MAPVSCATVANPVVLVHGFGSSFRHGWAELGWPDLLADEGREVIGPDLLGHGTASKPTDPAAYEALESHLAQSFDAYEQVDAVGFSLGARVLLTLASSAPKRFGRLVLLGVGAELLGPGHAAELADAVEAGAAPDDVTVGVFDRLAREPGNDRAALVALLRRQVPPLDEARLSHVTCPVLVVLGDQDPAGPGEPLVGALPDAQLVTLRGVDHFATPRDMRAIDATLRFLAG